MKLKILLDLYVSFMKIGGLTFGGGLAMLPMLQREVVDDHKWCTEEELLDIYAIGQCTPGIIAINTATSVGYKQAGILGGIFGTLGMVSPCLVIICLVASILNNFINLPVVVHALAGIRVVVCALMMNTVCTMAKKGIVDKLGGVMFAAAFILACFTPVPTVALILAAGVVGVIAKRFQKEAE